MDKHIELLIKLFVYYVKKQYENKNPLTYMDNTDKTDNIDTYSQSIIDRTAIGKDRIQRWVLNYLK